jgi:hypothetical protein
MVLVLMDKVLVELMSAKVMKVHQLVLVLMDKVLVELMEIDLMVSMFVNKLMVA